MLFNSTVSNGPVQDKADLLRSTLSFTLFMKVAVCVRLNQSDCTIVLCANRR